MAGRLLRLSVRHPRLVVGAALAITAALGAFIPEVEVRLDARPLLPLGEPQLQRSDEAARRFGARELVRGTAHHVELCITCLKAMGQMRVTANDDLAIRLSGPMAVATLSGVNEGLDETGRAGRGTWRWTLELENVGGKWLISHEHLSFYDPAEVK